MRELTSVISTAINASAFASNFVMNLTVNANLSVPSFSLEFGDFELQGVTPKVDFHALGNWTTMDDLKKGIIFNYTFSDPSFLKFLNVGGNHLCQALHIAKNLASNTSNSPLAKVKLPFSTASIEPILNNKFVQEMEEVALDACDSGQRLTTTAICAALKVAFAHNVCDSSVLKSDALFLNLSYVFLNITDTESFDLDFGKMAGIPNIPIGAGAHGDLVLHSQLVLNVPIVINFSTTIPTLGLTQNATLVLSSAFNIHDTLDLSIGAVRYPSLSIAWACFSSHPKLVSASGMLMLGLALLVVPRSRLQLFSRRGLTVVSILDMNFKARQDSALPSYSMASNPAPWLLQSLTWYLLSFTLPLAPTPQSLQTLPVAHP